MEVNSEEVRFGSHMGRGWRAKNDELLMMNGGEGHDHWGGRLELVRGGGHDQPAGLAIKLFIDWQFANMAWPPAALVVLEQLQEPL
jgi:hypothetical protein